MTLAAPTRPRAGRLLLLMAMPLTAMANQYLAMRTAQDLAGQPFGLAWLTDAARSHWVQAWVGCEIVTFAIWMVVLSDLTLSAAFPMTALGYVLVVGMGWVVFGEPLSWVEFVGGAAILAGVVLLGDPEAEQ